MSLKHYKTYRINTNDSIDIVDITRSRLCYINSRGAFGWCDVLSKISEIFLDAQLKSRFTTATPHYTIIVPEWMWQKVKPQDTYVSYDRIEFLLNHFNEPTNGLVVSVYITTTKYDKSLFIPYTIPHDSVSNGVEWPFCTNIKWNLKTLNKPKNYVTWNKVDTSWQKEVWPEILELEKRIENTLLDLGIPYENIDYTISPYDTYEIMSGSSLHISYIGASWWLSHYMNLPLIDYSQSHASGSYFGVLRSPGQGKDFPSTVWDEKYGKFKEEKQKSLTTLPNNSKLNDISKVILKYAQL